MTEEGLKLIIDADFSEGDKALAAFENRMNKAANTTVSAGKKMADSTELVVDKMGKLQKRGVNTSQVMMGFNNIVRDAPYGLIGMGNNITQVADALLGASAAAAAFSFGLSLAVTAGTMLVQKYGSLSAAIDILLDRLTAAEKAQIALNRAMEEGANNGQAEITHLDGLYRATQNLNIPLAERNKIVDELQKLYPQYFGNLSNEAILAGKAADAYKKLRVQIIAVAQSKAVEDEIVDLAKSGRELQKSYRDRVRAQLQALNTAEDYRRKIQELEREESAYDVTTTKLGRSIRRAELEKGLRSAEQAAAAYNDVLDSTKKQQADIEEQMELLAKEQQKLGERFGAAGLGIEDYSEKLEKAKEGLTVADVLKRLNEELAATDAQAKTFGITSDNLAKEKIAALNKAFDDLIKLGLKPASPEIRKIANEIERLSSSVIGDKTIQGQIIPKIVTQRSKTLSPDELSKVLGLQNNSALELEIKPKVIIDDQSVLPGLVNLDKASANFQKKVGDMAARARFLFQKNYIKWGDDLDKGLGPAIINIGNQIQNAVAGMAAGIGEAIGGLISGKDGLQGVLKGLVGLMADFIVQFGKSLIEAATLRIIAEKTLLANPYLALAAGIGAVAIGTALKNSMPAFATGGVVKGETIAMLGDNPSGVEYIIPKEVMDKIGGKGGGPLEVFGRFEMRGETAVALVESGKRTLNRR